MGVWNETVTEKNSLQRKAFIKLCSINFPQLMRSVCTTLVSLAYFGSVQAVQCFTREQKYEEFSF